MSQNAVQSDRKYQPNVSSSWQTQYSHKRYQVAAE